MREITLRQVEVIRALMLRGTITGAAEFLNVTPPGISRLIKNTEQQLGIRLFERRGGVFLPAKEAKLFFEQVKEVYRGVENLGVAIDAIKIGDGANLSFAAAPSVAAYVTPKAVRRVCDIYPQLYVDHNIVKFEEAAEYVMLEQGEFALMTSPVIYPGLQVERIGSVPVKAVLPADHRLANQDAISVVELAQEAIIGVSPADPYGSQLIQPFIDAQLDIRYSTRGRFPQTVVSLVKEGLGVALLDGLSVLGETDTRIVIKPLIEKHTTSVYTYVKSGRSVSSFAQATIEEVTKIIQSY